jgi:hypothetical protein
LNLFDFNNYPDKNAIVFANGFVIYISHEKPSIINNFSINNFILLTLITKRLKDLFNKVPIYFANWKLRTNVDKSETVLFRSCTSKWHKPNYGITEYSHKFKLYDLTFIAKMPIFHKSYFKYLKVNINFRLKAAIGDRIKMQLGKANKAFLANKIYFYIKNLNTKVELVCYKILIRFVIFYAVPMWSRPALSNRLDVLKVGTLGQVCSFTANSRLRLWVTLCFIILQQCCK